MSSLAATIATYRPDLITSDDVPIATTPPTSSTVSIKKRKNELTKRLMLATDWNNEDDPTGW